MNTETRNAVLKNIERLQQKALDRLDHLERSQALSEDLSAGVIMADITNELSKGYSDIHKTKEFKNLARY